MELDGINYGECPLANQILAVRFIGCHAANKEIITVWLQHFILIVSIFYAKMCDASKLISFTASCSTYLLQRVIWSASPCQYQSSLKWIYWYNNWSRLDNIPFTYVLNIIEHVHLYTAQTNEMHNFYKLIFNFWFLLHVSKARGFIFRETVVFAVWYVVHSNAHKVIASFFLSLDPEVT
jgi:hypothetical protein